MCYVQEGNCIRTLTDFTEPVSSVAWVPDGQSFVTGGLDEYLIQWDRDGKLIKRDASPRIYDLKITADGQKIVAVCTEKTLHIYDLHDWKTKRSYNLKCGLTGVQTSKDSRNAIVNTDAKKVIMVDLETGLEVQRYEGQIQDKWVIRGCLGGADENFVLSGSEGWFSLHEGLGEVLTKEQMPTSSYGTSKTASLSRS